MLYKPKNPPLINAFKFDRNKIGTAEYNRFKIESVQNYQVQGTCQCGRPLYEHGLIKGMGPTGYTFLCPDSYVIYENDKISNVMGAANFESIYVPLIDPKDVVMEI